MFDYSFAFANDHISFESSFAALLMQINERTIGVG
jgi:hypothetical protein